MPIRRIDKTLTATTATIAGEDIAASSIPVKPHIQPGVLQPAVAGKLLNGATHSGAYGTPQTQAGGDGHSYYYTDIKGSKAIKDPRIGGHFGSQRYKFKSLQLLEQETATHGSEVYSVDGREWVRIKGNAQVFNGDHGHFIQSNEAGNVTPNFFVEIVGYFNDFNVISRTHPTRVDDINVTVNGTTTNSSDTDKLGGKAVQNCPLRNRFVDSGSVINHDDSTVATNLGTTPKINTIKLEAINTGSEYWDLFGCELIAQDTTSTANKSKIQIPSQNVVSYGKKFTVSGTPHYDPFNGFTSGTDISGYIDEATSLGMSNWKVSSTWYRPFNGGRVVKWVDSSGTIKTSVTMMPPNAQNINGTASNAIDLSSSQTNDDTINFNTSAIDHSLSEVAKTFFAQEFGNGNANGGSSGTYKDMTMLNGSDQKASFVMDDGLTSLYGDGLEYWGTGGYGGNQVAKEATSGDFSINTFIGTGVSVVGYSDDSTRRSETIALNLPYSTHAFKQQRTGNNHPDLTLNGVSITKSGFNTKGSLLEITYHQPKKPPVPEDACILADYMLMADFVKTGTSGMDAMSKGVRKISTTRDLFVDSSAALSANVEINTAFSYFLRSFSSGSAKVTTKLPAFASEVTWQGEMGTASIDSSENSWGGNAITMAQASGGTAATEIITYSSGTKPELGMNNFQHLTQNGGYRTNAMEIATPIHTSSHYQSFETPYLHELVGGDRNMEQHNLIVTPDGKSWNEVTRDTSYLGKGCVLADYDGGGVGDSTLINWDEWRGKGTNMGTNSNVRRGLTQKDFAIAYDRVICLVDGQYKIYLQDQNSNDTSAHMQVHVNGNLYLKAYSGNGHGMVNTGPFNVQLSRGDYIQVYGRFNSYANICTYEITRI